MFFYDLDAFFFKFLNSKRRVHNKIYTNEDLKFRNKSWDRVKVDDFFF